MSRLGLLLFLLLTPLAGAQDFTVWSVGGNWTCSGRPTSVTQDGHGQLVFTNEYGQRSKGHFTDEDTLVASEWEGGLRGEVEDGRVIRWANGTVWIRQYSDSVPVSSLPALHGAWTCSGRPTSVRQDGASLVFTNEYGQTSNGYFTDANTVVASDWEGGLRGVLQDGGKTIRWVNGTAWSR